MKPKSRTYRVKLNEYLFRQVELIAKKANKKPEEVIQFFIAKRCNAPMSDITGKARFYRSNEVQCTRAENGGVK